MILINKLILFLSKYKKAEQNKPHKNMLGFLAGKPKPAVSASDSYASDLNIEITGSNTNDAPVKYFIEYLAWPLTSECKPAVLDEILCLISQESYQQGDHNLFAAMVHDYCCEKHPELYGDRNVAAIKPVISIIPYGFSLEKSAAAITDSKTSSALICQKISEHVAPEDQVFIDFTGGFRDVSFLMVLLIRYLEYLGISCGKVVYSNFNSRPKRIVDISYMYEAFQLINGAGEFTSFGSSRTLSRYWEGKFPPDHPVNDLLAAMKIFGESMSLCLVVDRQINDTLEAMNKSIAAIRSRSAADSDFESVMLRLILDEIARKFHLQNNEQLETMHLIRWCLDNDLIQQAITLYIEQLPEYYFTRGWLTFKSDETRQQISKAQYAKEFYEYLFNDFSSVPLVDTESSLLVNEFVAAKEKLKVNASFIKASLNEVTRKNKDKQIRQLCQKYFSDCQQQVKKAAYRLFNYLWLRYKGNGDEQIQAYSIIPERYNKILNGTDISKCLNTILNNQKVQQGLVLGFRTDAYDNDAAKPEYLKNDEAQKMTNKKKLSALHMLEQKINDTAFKLDWCHIGKPDLLTLFRNYHYLKIIRNQINHANVVELEPVVEEYYRNLGYNFELTVKNIRSNLQAALNHVQTLQEKYSELPFGR